MIRMCVGMVCLAIAALTSLGGCTGTRDASREVKGVVMRYNQLLSEGYRSMNMNPLQEVATPEQATRLYHHMAALGEGKLKLDSTLKDIQFVNVAYPSRDQATVETRETWDFTHLVIPTGKKYAQEKNFIYVMRYQLKNANGRWVIHAVDAIRDEGGETVIPWPEVKRTTDAPRPPAAGKPAGHP